MFPESTFESPVNKLPHDLLSKIFLRCLSEHPLDDAQPDTTIAPILLCHVCSSWRAVALTSAPLWSHLYNCLPLSWDKPKEGEGEEEEEIKLMVRSKVVFARALEFLQWWRTNQGSVDLFLRLDVNRMRWHDGSVSFNTDLPFCIDLLFNTDMASEDEDFLFDYLSSAHYLDAGAFHPYLVNQRLKRGFPVSFPSLRSLVISCFTRFSDGEIEYQPDIKMLPPQTPPTLRHLSIQAYKIPRNHSLYDWSALTHISLDDVDIFLHSWFTIIRALVDLQWGHFKVNVISDPPHTFEHTQPPMGVLAKLSTLILDVHIPIPNDDFSLSTLVQNMEFPTLHTLSLTSSAGGWCSPNALIDVHKVLKAAPALTKLAIGISNSQRGFLCFAYGASALYTSDLPSVINENVEPLLPYAPNLSHLQVELRCLHESTVAIVARNYVKLFLLSKRWLDLANPMSQIRRVTIVIKAIPWDVNLQFHGIYKALLKWNIRKYIKAPNVSFEILSEAEQGIGKFGDAWMSWGSKV
ncbi:hypothetical protein BJ912DRAFT_996215 [Pholiota molesta]|nr:hypothetical protein BJ912DRAFT_996215 [Pholiota molesta]